MSCCVSEHRIKYDYYCESVSSSASIEFSHERVQPRRHKLDYNLINLSFSV